MIKRLKIVCVHGTRYFPQATFSSEAYFAEYVKENETPQQAAKRRGQELYGEFNFRADAIRVDEVDHDTESGQERTIKQYYVDVDLAGGWTDAEIAAQELDKRFAWSNYKHDYCESLEDDRGGE